MKYFRAYPFGVQLLLLTMLWYTLFCATQYFFVPALFSGMTGFPVSQLEKITTSSPQSLIGGAITVIGIMNILVFSLSAFLFAYLTHPRPADYLGLKSPILKKQPVLAVLVILGAMPMLLSLESLISHINFGPEVKKAQADSENMMNAFLNISSVGSMLKVFFFLAIVPAVGEEMFFRGIVMKFLRKKTGSMTIPIIVSSLLFAGFHLDIYGLPSIFLAGVLLAVIYDLTGSLWCNIAAHVFFNGTQIVLNYVYNNNPAARAALDKNSVPVVLVIVGAVVFCISFYLLLKNKTPLPTTWANDFEPKEPKDDEWDFMTKS